MKYCNWIIFGSESLAIVFSIFHSLLFVLVLLLPEICV